MTDREIDDRLTALFAQEPARPDPAFADRIVELARFDLARRHARRRAWSRVAREALGLAAMLGSFALLARVPAAEAGAASGIIPWTSPAMFGIIALALWALTVTRDDEALRR